MRNYVPLIAAIALAAAPLAGDAQATSQTCSASTPSCDAVSNTYSGTASGGVAIHGASTSGIAIRGTSATNTGFYGASGSGSFLAPGVEGESTTAGSSDAGGAFGLSYFLNNNTMGTYGVLGYGAKYGTEGQTDTASSSADIEHFGVVGFDESTGTTYNAGTAGISIAGVGVLGESAGAPTLGFIGSFPIGMYAVAEETASSSSALGLEAESNNYALEARNTATSEQSTVDLADPGYLVQAGSNIKGGGTFYVSTRGNAYVSGTLTTSKSTYVRTAGTSGAARIAYGTRSTSPEIEDVGEGSLVNGRAVVAIDPALADSIDMRRAYHVFITPEGDCKGLYVTQKTPGSFVVRELQGGRSTLAFEYRIVAKPHDENGDRLALAPSIVRPAAFLTPRNAGRPARLPLSPDQELRAKLGPAGYARALAALRARINEK